MTLNSRTPSSSIKPQQRTHQPSTKKWKWKIEQPRKAAVLVPFVTISENNTPAVLFTVRSEKLNKHKGEVSFPGGIWEEGDADIIHTALRETEEEIGLNQKDVTILGELSSIPDRSMTIEVFPIIGYLGNLSTSNLKLNHDEVSQVFTMSIAQLVDPSQRELMQFRNEKISIPVWPNTSVGIPVWGLTAFVLDNVLRNVVVADPKVYP
ncbi:nudix (nucleoside diphosphate linked moiety X)-type motif 8 [Nowakowskiella sp. JEL0407]|nr:nudix (nucleoside diphosphate linked moiety X)-type motif 8 [Nowakowskiella sp. JEL0407]